MEATADHYATLGVEPGADGGAIRVAYRNLMRRYHPDVNSSDEAAAKATEINAAYACLSDPDERAHYDRIREALHSRPTFSTAGMSPPPHRSQRSPWQRQHAYMVDLEGEPPPTRWKAVSLGLAMVVTIITFKITSEINGLVMPAPPEQMTFVHTDAPPPPPIDEPGCKRAGGASPAACGPVKAMPQR